MLEQATYQKVFLTYLQTEDLIQSPKNLYHPIAYILQLGGKRVRPILTLMAADIFSDDYKKALPAALAVEFFHNFTLVHDDIMDQASIRRGKQTIHRKWNLNTGILSGDAMLILAYQYFENYEPLVFQALAKLFSKTALAVCNGQQLDTDFEIKNDVTIEQYITMIELKTAVLIAAALKMGAIVAKANTVQAQLLYDYGLNIGIAFQLQDDYLDIFGDTRIFGKKIGGDIAVNKKTFLYLKTLALANSKDEALLRTLFNQKLDDNSKKIETVTAIFKKYAIQDSIKKQVTYYTKKAFEKLNLMEISVDDKKTLKNFGKGLIHREV